MDKDLLGAIALGHAPLVSRQRTVAATRLTVSVLDRDRMPSPQGLLRTVEEVWPAGGRALGLHILSEEFLAAVLQTRLPKSVWVELPSFMAGDPAYSDSIRSLHARGVPVLLHGLPQPTLPPELLQCFKYSVVELAQDRPAEGGSQGAPAPSRRLPFIQSGVQTIAEMEASFERGAVATMGWPFSEVRDFQGNRPVQPELQALLELMRRVDAGEDVDKLEAVLKREPSLAFKLIRYINSPAFGLPVEITSFSQAIMLLGYQRLKRWLALLLAATAGRDAKMRPLVYASVLRGLLMEQLLASQSVDEEMRSELFICGVFSLLDRLLQRPFIELLGMMPLPERVQQALLQIGGPFQPYLELAQALEAGSGPVIAEMAEALMLPMSEVNAALMRAMVLAMQLD